MNTFNVNVHGYFFLTRELIPELKKSKYPHIINMSSVWGQQGNAKMFSYSVSKFAVEGLSRGMKEYCGSLGIKVSNIVLDKVDTNFREHIEKYVSFSEEQKEKMIQPEDVASAVLYLLTTSKNVLISTITLDAFLWS